MKSEQAKMMYGQFLDKLGKAYDPAKIQGDYIFSPSNDWYLFICIDGEFGAMMSVDISNDGKTAVNYGNVFIFLLGPVTLQLDSRKFTYDS